MIPELRKTVLIDASNDSCLVDAGVVTIAQATYQDVLALAVALRNAIAAAIPAKAWTLSYVATGINRGKFLLDCDAVFALDDNGENLLKVFGFYSPPYGGADGYQSDRPSAHIFTPPVDIKDENYSLIGGFAWEKYTDPFSTQTQCPDGTSMSVAAPVKQMARRLTFTGLAVYDVTWFRLFWDLVRNGQVLRMYQDRAVTTGFDEWLNPWGFFECKLKLDGGHECTHGRTQPGTRGVYDIPLSLVPP